MKRRIAFVVLWLFGLFAAVAYYVPLFTLHEIQVEGNAAHLESDIVALLNAETGTNLLRLDLEGWVTQIVRMPAIASARAFVTLSGNAVARVQAVVPVGLVDTHPVSGVTANGVLLPLKYHPADSSLPIITGIGGSPEYYARTSGRNLQSALEFLSRWNTRAPADAHHLAEIHMGAESEVGIYLWPNQLYVRMGRGEWNSKIDMVWPVLKRLPLSRRSLDLRFAGQVIEKL